jgi:probable HAF family extracellular repeat protein
MRATMGFRQRRRFLRWLAAMTGGIGLHGCGGSGDAPSAGEDLAGPLATPVCAHDDADRSVVRYSLTDLGALGAFLAIRGTMRDLGTLGRNRVGYAFNSRADVTGVAEFGPALRHAFLLRRSDGEALDLGTLGGLQSVGYDINDAGQIAGTSEIGETNAEHAFLYADGRMQDLGTLGGNASGGRAINVHGHVVGWAETGASRTHAFLYSGGLMKDIDVFDGPVSEAHGINAADWVVGLAVFPGHTARHGFVHDGTTLRDLNDLLIDGGRWEITEALDIDDAGQIVGSARPGSGAAAHAVLLTPPRAC